MVLQDLSDMTVSLQNRHYPKIIQVIFHYLQQLNSIAVKFLCLFQPKSI